MSPNLTRWFTSGKYFDYRGFGIFWKKSEGRKKDVILAIHSFPTASFDFAPVWATLSKNYTVITADMLGFGFSSKPADHDYSLLEQADIFEALLAQEKVRKYHIFAHDYGVSVAQELLARQKGDKRPVLSVCFLNGGLYPEFHKPLLVQKLMLTKLGPLLARFFSKKKLRSSFDAIFGEHKASAQELDEFWQLIEYNGGRRVVPRLMRYMIERREHRERWVSAMEDALIPVQMINGPLDPISGAHLAEAFALRNPRARVDSLPGVGHYPQVEAPGKVCALYLDFLRRGK